MKKLLVLSIFLGAFFFSGISIVFSEEEQYLTRIETTERTPHSLLITSTEDEIAYWEPSDEKIAIRLKDMPGDFDKLKSELSMAFSETNFSEELIKEVLEDFFLSNATSIDVTFYPLENVGLGVLVSQNDRTSTKINPPATFDDQVPPPPVSPLIKEAPCSGVLIPKAKGIVIASSKESLAYQSFDNLCGVEVLDICLPGPEEKLKQRLTPLFYGKSLTKKDILCIKKEIINFYKEFNRPVVAVQVPVQNVTSGVLKLVVIEAKLGKVYATCNKYFTSCQIEKYIRLKEGCPINEQKLIQDLNFINRNPFRRVDVVYTPGEKTHTTDIELYTQDRRPFRAYAGIENNGLRINGRDRWFVGFNWGNVFRLDHIFSYQYMKDYGGGEFWAHTAQYTAPLSWRHILYLYGGYSQVEPKSNVYPTSKNHGDSSQGSMRYHMPIWPVGRLLHDFVLGFDFKRTNNTAEFVEDVPRFAQSTNLSQFVMGYQANGDWNWVKSSLEANLFYSPGKLLPSQDNSDFNALQPGAKNNYLYSRVSWMNIFPLPWDFTMSLYAKGQMSSRILLPSERLGIGGYNSVRGYDEHSFNGDHGIIGSLELRTGSFSLLKYLSNKRIKDDLVVLGFVDIGKGWVNQVKLPGEKRDLFVIGAGPGLRYVINPNVSVRADWGFKLKNKKYFERDSLPHLEVTASY